MTNLEHFIISLQRHEAQAESEKPLVYGEESYVLQEELLFSTDFCGGVGGETSASTDLHALGDVIFPTVP